MNRSALTLLLAMTASVAMAGVDEGIESLVLSAARNGHPIEGMVQGRALVAVPVLKDKCFSVGVVYPKERGPRIGGPRIDNFRVCDNTVEPVEEVSPALPEDRSMQQTTIRVIRGALRYGAQRADWHGHRIGALRLAPTDPSGCGQVETVASYDGLLVAHQVGRMCP